MNCPTGSTVYETPQEARRVFQKMQKRGQRGHARMHHGKATTRRCEVCGHHHISHKAGK